MSVMGAHIHDFEGVCNGGVAVQQVQPLRSFRAANVQHLLLERSCRMRACVSTHAGMHFRGAPPHLSHVAHLQCPGGTCSS